MDEVCVRAAGVSDIPFIQALYAEYAPTILKVEDLKTNLETWPSGMVYVGEEAVGFGYSKRFAPDILELCNLFVASRYRSRGIGAALLAFIEDRARAAFAGIVLVNSLTHATHETKRFAKSFYLAHDYRLILTTGESDVYGKTW